MPGYGTVLKTRQAAEACAGPLRDRLAIDTQHPLGCGAYGCVYKQRGTKNVVKLVAGDGARDELQASLFLVGKANEGNTHPQLPRIFEIWDLGQCAEDFTASSGLEAAYAIVREDLRDVPWDIEPYKWPHPPDPLHSAIEAMIEAEAARWSIDSGEGDPEYEAATLAVQDERFEFQVEQLTTHDQKLVSRMRPLFRWGFQNGIRFEDTHFENWGLRADGELVLRDIGRWEPTDWSRGIDTPDDPELPALSGFVVLRGLKKMGGRSWRRAR